MKPKTPRPTHCADCNAPIVQANRARRIYCPDCGDERTAQSKRTAQAKHYRAKKALLTIVVAATPVETEPPQRIYTGEQLIAARQGKLGPLAKLRTNPF